MPLVSLKHHIAVLMQKGKVTTQIDYLTADEEDNYVVAQANALLDDEGNFLDDEIIARFRGENTVVPRSQIDYMDVSPKQVVSPATACIPFLENDDSNRALMGANMRSEERRVGNEETNVC